MTSETVSGVQGAWSLTANATIILALLSSSKLHINTAHQTPLRVLIQILQTKHAQVQIFLLLYPEFANRVTTHSVSQGQNLSRLGLSLSEYVVLQQS